MADLLPSSRDPSAGDGGEPKVIGVDSDDADDLLAALQSETARDLLASLYDDPATPSELAEDLDTSIQNVRYHLERLTDADLVEVADTVYSEKGREMKVYAPAAKPLVVFAGSDDDAPGLQTALSRLLGGLGVLALSSVVIQRIFGGRNPGSVDLSSDRYWTGGSAEATTAAENVTAGGPSEEMEMETTVAADSGEAAATEATRTTATQPQTTAEATGTDVEATPTTAEETVAEATETAARTTPDAATTESATETAMTLTEQAAEATTTVAESGDAALGTLPPGLVFFAGGAVVLLALGLAWALRGE